jgi:hypothetical protein
MDLIPLIGSAPEWASTAIAVLATRQKSRVTDFFDQLVELGITPERLSDAVAQAERLGDLLTESAETAGRCPDAERRRLLALAVVSGVEDSVPIDDLQFFTRAMREVSPIHMKLLGLIASKTELSTQDMALQWPEASEMLNPMRALLDREGLIEDISLGVSNSYATGSWALTPYGHRFMQFVQSGATRK